MSVLFILLTASLLVALVFLGAFVWAARSGQFEDTETPPMRMLADDGDAPPPDPAAGKERRKT